MNSAVTVLPHSGSGKNRATHRFVRIVGAEGLSEFVRVAVEGRARRVSVVSPWVSSPSSLREVAAIIGHIERRRGRLLVVTRVAGQGTSQRLAVQRLAATPGGSVYDLPNLHAKMYLAELAGGRVAALIGSANMTSTSQMLREAGVLLVTKHRSRLGRDLERAVRELTSSAKRVEGVDLVTESLDVAGFDCLPFRRAC